MPSTYTVNLGIEKPATGEQSGTWGDTTNVNFDILDQAINGAERVTLSSAGSSGSPNALIITNGAASDGRNKWIEFYSSGDLGGDVFVHPKRGGGWIYFEEFNGIGWEVQERDKNDDTTRKYGFDGDDYYDKIVKPLDLSGLNNVRV